MKLTQDTSPVETGLAVEAPRQFQIAASKEAFKILSSGLYNNKILAIVRELSCNAYDAHVAAGKKDVPFEIHLPTIYEPFFSVKDDGVGLSHEEVLSLYTTYFGTNKSESNDFVGALGLGSKSPFCYTEGFTVTSRYQDYTRIYSCFIDQNGMPAVQLQEENYTPGEVNGLEVMFPVNQNDVWEFENQAATALEFFDPKPTLNTEITYNHHDYVVKTATWGMRKERHTKHGSGIRAIQGMVQYALGTIDESRLSEDQKSVIKLPLDIFFNIGDLAVAASRETLSNDEHTIGNILKALDSIKGTLLQTVKDEVAKCKTHWEARLKIFQMVNSEGIGAMVNNAWNNGELDGSFPGLTKDIPSINQIDYPRLDAFAFFKRYRGSQKIRVGQDMTKYTPGSLRDLYDVQFKIEKDVVFVINDFGFGGEKYIHAFLEDSRYNTAYYINRRNKDISVVDVKKDALKIIESLGGPPFVCLTELRDKYQSSHKTLPQSSPVRKLLYFNVDRNVRHYREGYTVQGWTDGWDDATGKALPQGVKYYVPVKRLEPQNCHFAHAEEFKKFILAVKKSGLFGIGKDDLIYGVPVGTSPIPKGKDWVEFTGHVFRELPKVMTPQRELALSVHLKAVRTHISPVIKKLGVNPTLSKSSPMQAFCSDLHEAQKGTQDEREGLAVVVEKALAEKRIKVNLTDFNARWEEVRKNYPLVEHLTNCWYDDTKMIKQYIDYFRLVDEERERKAALVVSNPEVSVYSDNMEEEAVTPNGSL